MYYVCILYVICHMYIFCTLYQYFVIALVFFADQLHLVRVLISFSDLFQMVLIQHHFILKKHEIDNMGGSFNFVMLYPMVGDL